MISRLLTGCAAVCTLLAALLINDTQDFLRIDANGPKLRMQVLGNLSPAVVFENGGGGSLELWGTVPARVSEFAKAVVYDRAGDGMSDGAVTPRDGQNVASELHTALRNANVRPPYVFVGHSLGGPYARVFAGMYAKEVVGIVLVDPTQEAMVDWNDDHGFSRPVDRPEFLSRTLDQARESRLPPNIPVSLIHVMWPWPHGPFPSEEVDEAVARVASRVPLRLKFHKEWLDRVNGAEFVSTEISSHAGINLEEPELVTQTIRNVVERARQRALSVDLP